MQISRTRDKNNVSSEDDTENEEEKSVQNNNHFIQNPAELRAKAEQRKQFARDGRNARDVNGKLQIYLCNFL